MDPLLYLALTTAILLLIRWLLQPSTRNSAGLPPGPAGLPFLGYYPFLGADPHVTLDKLKRKYGGVFGVYLGSKYCVVLGDVEALKEAYGKDEFHGRPPDSPFKLSKTTSLIELGGQDWSDQRRFSLRVLRNLGFGKTRMEDVIKHEIEVMFEEFDGSDGSRRPELFHQLFSHTTTNIVAVLLFGQRMCSTEIKRQVVDEYLVKIGEFHRQLSLHTFFPWTRKLLMAFSLLRYGNAKTYIGDLENLNWREIEDHEQTIDEENVRDYIDSFLIETQKRGDRPGPFNKATLNGNLALFLRAGSMTTRATVEWALLAVALQPHIQNRVREEIQQVLQDSRPCWSHRESMPYTNAVLLETQRWRTIVPINILRYTTQETSVKGYRVPAGTVVISNLWSIHNDPQYWSEPEEFRPERMLTSDGKALTKFPEAFVSFSTGRRACPGQALALMEMFLCFTSILQRYRVSIPEGQKPDMNGQVHITWQPKNLQLTLTPL